VIPAQRSPRPAGPGANSIAPQPRSGFSSPSSHSSGTHFRWSHFWSQFSGTEKYLILLFILTLPLVNPWVRGDGVGYYAYARAPLVENSFNFENDWKHADEVFRVAKLDANGNVQSGEFTRTGHVDNHFTVGPALLWMPFLLPTHAVILLLDKLGRHIPADGFSRPYRTAMALGTSFYGFLGLLLSYRVAIKYTSNYAATAATLAIWFGSSLIVYMYFNPAWSHAHSAFTVALFIWYWNRTRGTRTIHQWAVLGLLGGLMADVYYPNALLMLLPLVETMVLLVGTKSSVARRTALTPLAIGNLICGAGFLFAMLPTFFTRWIVYGSPLEAGSYTHWAWHFGSPALLPVLFSADHGLFSWTPLIMLSIIGLFFLVPRHRLLAVALIITLLAYFYLIASFPFWDGESSFGNRFFISLTALFVIGLAALLDSLAAATVHAHQLLRKAPSAALGLLVLWNLGMVFQWGTHLIPARGPISWPQMAYNQVAVVPVRAGDAVARYFVNRKGLMRQIEQQDVQQLKQKSRQEQ